MAVNKEKTNMITGRPFLALLAFALPMVIGNLFQQLYNIVDSIIVGKFVGQNALAAVGSTSTILNVYIAISLGLATGCMIVFSQLYGARHIGRMRTAMYTCVIFLAALSVIAGAAGLLSTDGVLTLTNVREELYSEARTYYIIYVLGFPAMFLYNATNSIFNSLGKSKYTLCLLASSSVLNVILDLWFTPEAIVIGGTKIQCLGLGVAGAAIATDISQYVIAIIGLIWSLVFLSRKYKTDERYKAFEFKLLGNMSKVAVPTMIAQEVVAIGYVALQSLVNMYSVDVISGYVAAYKIDSLCSIPMVQIGNAMATYTGQNVGAQKFERVPKGIRSGALMCCVIWAVFILIVRLAGHGLVGLFMDEGVSEVAYQAGVQYMSIMSYTYIMLGLMYLLAATLRGAGDALVSVVAVIANFGGRCLFAFIVAYFVLGTAAGSEIWIWISNPLGWFIAIVICFLRYRTGIWKTKRLADKV